MYSIYLKVTQRIVTYDHRLRKTGHPVRSAIHKPQIGRLVVGWVTTSESLLLYVFALFLIYNSAFLALWLPLFREKSEDLNLEQLSH